jgi:metallophosphoesterase superfamily enzyme
MKVPMREKYVDERVGIYFIFGNHDNGTVDISNSINDTLFDSLPKEQAIEVCQAQEEFRRKLYKILCSF